MTGTETTIHVIVGCGASKRPGSHAAKDKYDSVYFSLKRAYAESVGDDWSVLSAKHGLINPGCEIGDYDVTVGEDLAGGEWQQRVQDSVSQRPAVTDADRIEVLAGRRYTEPIKGVFAHLPCEVAYPFESDELGGIGEQMAWLKTNA